MDIGLIITLAVLLYPVYWIWDNSGGGVFSAVMAVVIGGGALLIFFSMVSFSS